MLGAALSASAVSLLAHPERKLTAAEATRYSQSLQRRAAGEPVAYLIGHREFYGRRFEVCASVLIPRPETELLVDLALTHCREQASPAIVDLGTGSGAVAVTLKLERPDARVSATDHSPAALEIAHANAVRMGATLRLVEGDWLATLGGERFDLIVSNPPYIAAGDAHLGEGDLRWEPRSALVPGPRGSEALAAIIAAAPAHLASGGWLLLEHGYDQGAICRRLLGHAGLANIATWRDLAGIERVSGARTG